MPRSRHSIRCLALVALGLLPVACAAAKPIAQGTPDEERPARRPDAVHVDLPAAIPAPRSVDSSGAVVALREAPSDEDVRDVVVAFVRAVDRGDFEQVQRFVSSDASLLATRLHPARGGLLEFLRARVRTEGVRVAGSEAIRRDQVRVASSSAIPVRRRPTELRDGDRIASAPVELSRLASDRVFGEVIVLVVRPEARGLKIVGYADAELP